MAAPVAERVASVLRPEAPGARQEHGVVPAVRNRTLPALPVEFVGHLRLLLQLVEAVHEAVDRRTPHVRLRGLAYEPGLHPLAEVAYRVVCVPLVHRLVDEFRMAAHGCEHLVHLVEALAQRLLALHVLAALEALDGHARVPVVRHPDHHCVHLAVVRVEHAAPVAVERRVLVAREHRSDAPRVHVAQRDYARARGGKSVDVRDRAPGRAYRGDLHRLVRAVLRRAAGENHWKAERAGGGRGGGEELASRCLHAAMIPIMDAACKWYMFYDPWTAVQNR